MEMARVALDARERTRAESFSQTGQGQVQGSQIE